MATPPQFQPSLAPLGSLAQSSRLKELKSARWILIILGIINVALHAFMVTQVEKEVDTAFKKEIAALGPGAVIDHAAVAELQTDTEKKVRFAYLLGVAVGIVFIACGILVYKAPVPATLTGFIVYIAIIAASAMFDPKTIAQGILLKIIIIACLAKAVQAAFAYKREAEQANVRGAAA